MEIVLWSSISLASLRASSTGCTVERNVRENTPSKRPPIFCSMLRRTLSRLVRIEGNRGGGGRLPAQPDTGRRKRRGGWQYSHQSGCGCRRGDRLGVARERRRQRHRGERETESPQRQR